MTFQSGSLPGGNASLSEVRSRGGFPGLQRTLRRNLWGKAQTEGGTRSSEVGRGGFSITLDSCNTFQAKNMPTIILSWSLCLWWTQQALRFWRHQLRKSIHKLEHQQCPVPPKYLFIILYVAFGRRGCSRIWLLSLRNNSIFRLYGILYHWI